MSDYLLAIVLSKLAELQIAIQEEEVFLNNEDSYSPQGNNFLDQMYEIENEVLTHFGLPSTRDNLSIIYFDVLPSVEECENRVLQLHKKATEYLSRNVKSEIQTLEEAQKFNHNCFDVLPELKIRTTSYTNFVFDEMLLKKQDTVENILSVLKFVSEPEIAEALGYLILSKDEQVRREKYEFLVLKKEIKYIDEYIGFFLPNPEELKRTVYLYPLTSENIFKEPALNQNANLDIVSSYSSQSKILSTQKDIANELIEFFLENKRQFGYINLNKENKYDGWVGDFHIKFSGNGQKMSLDLKEEKDLFLLFALAVVWSRTGPWENAAFFVTYLKFYEKNDPKYWQIESNVEIENKNRKLSKEKIIREAKSVQNSRKEISFREDIFESIHILANNWEDILSSLTSSYHNNNYVPFMKKMRGIEGLAGPERRMSIKIPLILRELRCQKVFDNIPGEFCCVADDRVVKACKKIGIKLPIVTREIPNLIVVSTKIYMLFGDLYDLPLFAVKDIS